MEGDAMVSFSEEDISLMKINEVKVKQIGFTLG